jgi:26S proteasome regulatory subunit N8
MYGMMRKINSKEVLVGWYSSGPSIRKNDIDMNEVVRKYCTNPAFVIIRVQDE